MSDTAQPIDGPEASDAPPSQVRKVARTQNFESTAYDVDNLEKTLVSRKLGKGAQYWRLLDVKRVWDAERDGDGSVSFEKVVLVCNQCGHEHGGKSVAPANFARSHFLDYTAYKVQKDRAYWCVLSALKACTNVCEWWW